MDAEYLKEKNRMTKECSIPCSKCPLHKNQTACQYSCGSLEKKDPEKAVRIVENWAKEHPVRTYKSAFLEKFPDAELGCEDGAPYVCLYYIFGLKHAPDYCKRNSATCFKCWNREVEE